MNANDPQAERPGTAAPGRRDVVRAGVRFLLMLLLLCGVLFLAAGTLAWPMAWVYVAITLFGTLVSRLLVLRRHPDLLQERAGYAQKSDAKSWDRFLVQFVAIIGPVATQIVAGLNYRFGWPPTVPLGVALIGAALVIAGWALGTWAMVTNRFFSAVVRIQTDRGHHVVDSGPYHWLRHPAYAGGVVANLAVPLMLGSAWALIPGALTAALIVLRGGLEDRTLRAELPGYAEYAQRTCYRLLPGVW